ncbi:MAG: hypothetical protein ACFFC7_32200 [Candidatus Hermodarchaeota archaeon]
MSEFNFGSLAKDTPKPIKKPTKRQSQHVNPHILTRENMIRFVTAKGMMKKVEANWFFLPTPALEVSNLIDKLLKKGVFKRIKNGWIVIAKK